MALSLGAFVCLWVGPRDTRDILQQTHAELSAFFLEDLLLPPDDSV